MLFGTTTDVAAAFHLPSTSHPSGITQRVPALPATPREVLLNNHAPTVVVAGRSAAQLAAEAVHRAQSAGHLLPQRAWTVYHAVCEAAYTLMIMRGQNVLATRCMFFTVADLLPLLTGQSRATMYRGYRELCVAGLLASRAWRTTGKRLNRATQQREVGTVAGGVVLDVLLVPAPDRTARVRWSDMRGAFFRDLQADCANGQTAWTHLQAERAARTEIKELLANGNLALAYEAAERHGVNVDKGEVRQSLDPKRKETMIRRLLQWALSSVTQNSPVTMTVSLEGARAIDRVWALSELMNVREQDRGEVIEQHAELLAEAFSDGRSESMWRWLLWSVVKLEENGITALQPIQAMLARLNADRAEWEGLRNPGALLVARLQATGWWTQMQGVRMAAPFTP